MSTSDPQPAPHHAWCVVLDVDDTLYLERDYVRSGFHAVGLWLEANHGVSGFGPRAWDAFERGVRGNTFNLILDQLGHPYDRDLIRQLVRVYRHHTPDITLLPDARACIDALRALTPPAHLAAITDGPEPSQRAKVNALGVPSIAAPTILTSTLGPNMGKPHPAAFERVQAHTQLPPSRHVYVADNPTKDFIAPRQLGWRTLRIRRPLGLHADHPGGDDIDAELPDMTGLVDWLLG